MISNNRFATVPREHVNGHIEGHDFGYGLRVLVRSPRAILMWNAGTAFTSGRRTSYGESNLLLFPDRRANANGGGHLQYRRLGDDGGRLSVARVMAQREALIFAFGEDALPAIMAAIRTKQTLLIEGGGGRLHPYRDPKWGWIEGQEILNAWKAEPNRGFCCDPL